MNETTYTTEVTQCQIYPLREPLGRTRAFARILINDCLQLTGIRIVDGSNGLFAAYPNDPSIFDPVTRELRDKIETLLIAKYEEAMNEK
jgi:stage V sporulation protein G